MTKALHVGLVRDLMARYHDRTWLEWYRDGAWYHLSHTGLPSRWDPARRCWDPYLDREVDDVDLRCAGRLICPDPLSALDPEKRGPITDVPADDAPSAELEPYRVGLVRDLLPCPVGHRIEWQREAGGYWYGTIGPAIGDMYPLMWFDTEVGLTPDEGDGRWPAGFAPRRLK